MRKTFTAVLAVLAVAVTSLPAAASPACASQGEHAALTARVLQSELMVAALACEARGQYNRFVQAHKRELSSFGSPLKRYFNRLHGTGGQERLDSFVTRMANDAARRSAGHPGFCEAAAKRFAALVGPDAAVTADVSEFARTEGMAAWHGIALCPREARRP